MRQNEGFTRAEWDDVKMDLLEHCRLDYVGLWVFAMTIREELGLQEVATVRRASLGLIDELLSERLVVVGDLDFRAGRFLPWTEGREETLKRIKREWETLGRDPDQLEVCWLTTTKEGDEWVEERLGPIPEISAPN